MLEENYIPKEWSETRIEVLKKGGNTTKEKYGIVIEEALMELVCSAFERLQMKASSSL